MKSMSKKHLITLSVISLFEIIECQTVTSLMCWSNLIQEKWPINTVVKIHACVDGCPLEKTWKEIATEYFKQKLQPTLKRIGNLF